MEITKREILISTVIVAVMLGIGIWISSPILSKALNNYIEIASSVVVGDAEKFDYIKRTDAGRFIADGTLYVTDTVRLEELHKPYSYIKKVKEEYRLHTETYTTTDGKGHVQTHTRTYHSWDEMKHWTYKSENGVFLGQDFKMAELYRYRSKKDTTINMPKKFLENDTRYVYYTCPPSFDGVLVGTALNKQYNDVKFKEGMDSAKYLEHNERSINSGTAVFWILWVLLTGFIVVGFYALENKWLY